MNSKKEGNLKKKRRITESTEWYRKYLQAVC